MHANDYQQSRIHQNLHLFRSIIAKFPFDKAGFLNENFLPQKHNGCHAYW